ncbi:hypothetical protein R1sor_022882 [Riccia sorocarpa]|uniref:Uncharacterized protein n=1 Tax=Riccia sorocarpa TaxID=122646 RepID=A0ABD3GMP4_9MARC
MLEMDSLAPMLTEFVELANRYEGWAGTMCVGPPMLHAGSFQDPAWLDFYVVDVFILDDSVQKNLTNHIYQALHPRTFDRMKTAKKDDNYLNSVLLLVLDEFRFHRHDMMSFVEANWQPAQAQEPFGKMTAYWGTMDTRDEAFIWR